MLEIEIGHGHTHAIDARPYTTRVSNLLVYVSCRYPRQQVIELVNETLRYRNFMTWKHQGHTDPIQTTRRVHALGRF